MCSIRSGGWRFFGACRRWACAVMNSRLLRAGIEGAQYRFCNLPGHSLGYGVLDGKHTLGPDVLCFTRPRSGVQSIELFTDGYLTCPRGTRVVDWEAEFARVEAQDPEKVQHHPGVKGSSSRYFSDDRTVVTVHGLAPDHNTF